MLGIHNGSLKYSRVLFRVHKGEGGRVPIRDDIRVGGVIGRDNWEGFSCFLQDVIEMESLRKIDCGEVTVANA